MTPQRLSLLLCPHIKTVNSDISDEGKRSFEVLSCSVDKNASTNDVTEQHAGISTCRPLRNNETDLDSKADIREGWKDELVIRTLE
jgi:hypothetical protein